jgi:MraZ protein
MPEVKQSAKKFRGSMVHGIDASRRVMLPAEWREQVKGGGFTAIVMPIFGPGQYLLVLPPERLDLMLAKLNENESLSSEMAAAVERRIGGTSVEVELDSHGRFCVPENLARAAGLEKNATFVGRVDKFEIWNPERYAAKEIEMNDQLVSAAEKIKI